jgi:hypothetical protein
VALHEVIVVAVVVLNFTVLVPCVVPKFDPVIVTDAVTGPEVGDRFVMLGAATTVNALPLEATPPTVTTTFPFVAPLGTVAAIEVDVQPVTAVAVTPLNFTVLVPCVVPKLVPVIVITAPTAPVAGDRVVIVGAAASRHPEHAKKLTIKAPSCRVARITITSATVNLVQQFLPVSTAWRFAREVQAHT